MAISLGSLIPRRSAWNRGSAAVEFAITVPFLVLLGLGVADYGSMTAQSSNLAAYARAGAEYAASQAVQYNYNVSVAAVCPGCGNSTATCYCSDNNGGSPGNGTSIPCPGLGDPEPAACAQIGPLWFGYASVTATINPFTPWFNYAGFAPFPASLSSTTVIRFR